VLVTVGVGGSGLVRGAVRFGTRGTREGVKQHGGQGSSGRCGDWRVLLGVAELFWSDLLIFCAAEPETWTREQCVTWMNKVILTLSVFIALEN
jgi:hypothetical protein